MGTPPMREMLAAVTPVGTGGGRSTCGWACSGLGSEPPLVLGRPAVALATPALGIPTLEDMAEAEWGRVALVL